VRNMATAGRVLRHVAGMRGTGAALRPCRWRTAAPRSLLDVRRPSLHLSYRLAHTTCICRGVQRGRLVAAARNNGRTFATAPSTKEKAPTSEDAMPELRTSDESASLLRIRHSSAHIMAMAVQKLYPGAQVTVGPWTDYGFFYDFDLKEPLTDGDLKAIRKEMIRIVKRNLPIWREEVSKEVATERIKEINEPYKLDILDSIVEREPEATITIYHMGDLDDKDHWWDLCAGPHVESTGKINPKAMALESVSGAYWRGDESKQMLQRIYGTAWESVPELKAYERMKREAKKRDHRKLGQNMDLFSIQDSAGGGLVFWHPKGAMVRHLIEDFWRNIHLAQGYDLVYSPHIAKIDLWKTSGHLDFYGENMFQSIGVDEEHYQLRPMNCPFHITMYKDKLHSYREFPIRWAELGTVYRYERSGALHGLFRVRGFTQDDAHIFCLPSQLTSEIKKVLDLVEDLLSAFGFVDYEINLSTRPEQSVGSDQVWEQAEDALEGALRLKGWEFSIDAGGGAFYGPKIDLKIKDAIGRRWQCSTIQVDFNLAERFNLEYVDEANTRQRPILIHRAIFGSVERFFGILIENYAGNFPLWMAPVQARVVVVTDTVLDYASECVESMKRKGLRVDMAGGESLGKLIRNAELEKIPLVLVVGNSEVETNTLAVRSRHQGDLGSMSVEDLSQTMLSAVSEKIKF